MNSLEILNQYESSELQVRMLAGITSENVADTKTSSATAITLDLFDALRGRVLKKLASLRTELTSAQDFLRHCDAMPRSERRLYGTRAKEVQEKGISLQLRIDKLSLAEGRRVDILRERAQNGLAILLRR
jgi:hypothetical protein